MVRITQIYFTVLLRAVFFFTGICMHACALNVPSQDCPMHIESFRSNLSSNVSQRLKDKVIISANIDASGQYIPP